MDTTSTTHRNSRQSAPYGHACIGCARAKCRCISGQEGRCERCQRLDKECLPSPTVRKQQTATSPGSRASDLREAREGTGNSGRRAGRTNAGLPSRHATTSSHHQDRTAQLEQKLDNLVNLLTTQAQAQAQTQQDTTHGLATGGPSPSTLSAQASASSHMPSGSSSGNTPASLLRSAPISSPLEEDYLRQFRNVHLQSCPFLYIPPEVTADEVKQNRPFLWLNIRSVCCKSSHEVVVIDNEIRAILAQKVIIDLERSMDLLQGLLVFLIWTTRRFRDKPFLSVYSGIATSMVSDLRLDRVMLETINRETNSSNAFAQPLRRPLPNLQRTNEERRTVLGCYILSAGLNMFLRTPAMRWTHHMEECLQHLIDHPEVPGDTALTIIVRVDRILEDVVNAGAWRWDLENPKHSELPSPMLFVNPLRANLKAIVDENRSVILCNKFIRTHIAHAEILINDLPLFPIFAPPKSQTGGRMDVDRVSCLHRCLEAMRRYFDVWLSLTPEELFCSPSYLGIAYSRAVHILYRLSCVDDPSWEKSMVRETLDVVDALDKGADHFGSIPEALGLTTRDDDVFNRTAPMLRACKGLWRRNIEESANNGSNHVTTSDVMQAAATAQASAMDGEFPTLVPPQQTHMLQEDFTFMDYVSDNWQADPSLGWLFTSANTAPFFS